MSPLKRFCKNQGICVNKKKAELVALANTLSIQNAPVVVTKEQEKVAIAKDYASQLEVTVEGKRLQIPDPLQFDDWEKEKSAISKRPPCMHMNTCDYLVEKDQRDLLTPLKNNCKEGKLMEQFLIHSL